MVGSEGTSGMVTDDSNILRLDNLESGLVRRACGAPYRGDISKNGST